MSNKTAVRIRTSTFEPNESIRGGRGRGSGTHRTPYKTGVYTLVSQVCRLRDDKVHTVTVKSIYHKRGKCYGYIKNGDQKLRVVRIQGCAWEIL